MNNALGFVTACTTPVDVGLRATSLLQRTFAQSTFTSRRHDKLSMSLEMNPVEVKTKKTKKKSGLNPDALVTIGLPKGSLQEQTLALFQRAGWNIRFKSSRSYFPNIDDPEMNGLLFRAQELGRYTMNNTVDCAITGYDWIVENGAADHVVEIGELNYSKVNDGNVRWVLAVPQDSKIQFVKDLEGGTISTELMETTKRYFKDNGVNVNIEFSWGATEVKASGLLVDAIVDVTETGESLRANNLRILDTVLTSSTRFIANKDAWNDPKKRAKMEEIYMLLNGALQAKRMVGLKMNAPKNILDKVLKVLPSTTSPTISPLFDDNYVALEVVVDDNTERHWIPELKRLGCSGILTYPINLIVF